MTSIVKANNKNIQLLTDIGRISFIESHGNSASEADINEYVKKNYTYEAIREEIRNADNIYHIIYFDKQPAGYSKIIYNVPHANIPVENVTKLDRIYLLHDFYGLKFGY